LLAAALLASGCAGAKSLPFNWNPPSLPDVKPLKKKRSTELELAFEQSRDKAQCDAARSHLAQGNYRAACQQLESLLARHPDDPTVHLMLIESLIRDRRPAEACAKADVAMRKFPNDADVTLAAGAAYEAAGHREEAIAWFEKAAELLPESNREVMTASATVDEPLETSSRRARGPEKARTIEKVSESALLFKAEVCRALGQDDHAEKLLAGLPTMPEPPSDAPIAFSPESQRQVDQTAAEVPAELAPPFPAPRTNASRPDAAETSLDPDQLLARATSALAAGSAEVAGQHLQRLIDHARTSESRAVAAVILPLRYDQAELSAQLAQHAQRRWPQNIRLLEIEGTARYRLKQYHAARAALERALALDNRQAAAHFLLGSTLERLGDQVSADEHLRRARQLDPRYTIKR
jgi:Flp pilus assembly protein TadD